MIQNRLRAATLLIILIGSTVLLAGDPKSSAPDTLVVGTSSVFRGPMPNTYGTLSKTVFALSAWDAHPIDSTFTYKYVTFNGGYGIAQTNLTGSPWAHAPLHLPNGALLTDVELNTVTIRQRRICTRGSSSSRRTVRL